MKKYFFTLILIPFFIQISAANEARLLRFPTVYNNNIVFTYAGNLYTVSTNGGTARKLTSHQGVENFARFSHDGKFIAFTGQYDGNTEVYLMPSEGGVPKRLTYTATLGRDDVSDRMGPNNIVIGWTHDNKNILFRSRKKEFNDFKGRLFLVPVTGDLSKQLPLPRGGFASYSPDDSKLAYNQVFREFRTWKRYRGGMADDISIYDFNTKKTIKITDNPAQDIIPMWSGDNIYFLSDRDKIMNLFVYNLNNQETRKLTNFTEFDVKFPSLGNNAIVFENGGYIYLFDLTSEQAKKVDIQFAEDLVIGRGGLLDVNGDISNYEISPEGSRALFGARGEIFTVPAKNGITRNLTQSSGIHERNSKWSPDGKYIAFISDKTGEDEIYIIAQDGSSEPVQLTKGGGSYKFQLMWSPDSKKILFNDREVNLKYVDIDTKEVTLVLNSEVGRSLWGVWSPDSKWIAFPKPEYREVGRIHIYSLSDKKTYPVTSEWYPSFNPAFSSDGKYLVFISSRDFNPTYSWTEWNHAYTDMNGVYLIPLSKETKSPFAPENDEVKIETEKEKKDDDKKDEKSEVEVKIDFDNIIDRTIKLPIKASNYWAATAVDDKVYYIRNGSSDSKSLLMLYDLKEKEETEIGEIGGFEISSDNKKMLVSLSGSYYIIPLPTKSMSLKDKIDLSGLKMNLDRQAEWNQIFEQAWRQMRDFFYVPNMHGVDWVAVKKKYEPLLEHVSNRIDLSYIIGEMIGELNVGHAYVTGGDYPKADRIKTGLLGAEIVRDKDSKYYQIKNILEGRNWDSNLRSPLTENGIDAKAGDFIISVNGVPTNEMTNFYASLVGLADKQVKLELNSKPEKEGAKEVTVVPIDDEAELYYFDWVQNNIEKVNKATDGKVGYIHVPDMGRKGLNEFMKHFYPQLNKKALIVDVRGNGGGNVSPMLIERLRRETAMIDNMRNALPTPDPSAQVTGPKVCLLDEFSASDGDLFPYRFKKHNIGKLIGKRSWGGVIGISGSVPYVDGGSLNVPEYGSFSTDGKEWIIEGRGVEPDIVVENDPALEYEGVDQQLNRAIEEILKELETQEFDVPNTPPYPIKN